MQFRNRKANLVGKELNKWSFDYVFHRFRQGTNFRPAEKFDWRLSSYKTVIILALFTRNFERLDVSRRLNFRTVKGRNLSW